MNFRQLRYFVALAEELHFGRAAALLNIAQPPLSQQIKALEAELDVSLFDRSTRPIRVTPAGLALLREGRSILAQVSRAETIVRREGGEGAGRIVIGITGTAALKFAAPVLRVLSQRRPNVQVSLWEMSSPAQLDALEKGEIHIGFVVPRSRTNALASGWSTRSPFTSPYPMIISRRATARFGLPNLAGRH